MIKKQRLPNGLTVLTESMPHVRSVSIGVWLRLGSRNEPARVNGISHFIEHLLFKGTANRTAREIALAMDSVGGHMDAFTSKEYTCFYAKVLDERVPIALDILADIVQRPLFDATELERERKVVLEEIRMVEDTPDDLVYDLFSQSFYPTNALGRPIQGTADSVAGLSRRQLLNFFRKAYRPENMLIVAAGNLRHESLVRRIGRAFAGLEKGRPRVNGKPSRPRAVAAVSTRTRRELEQLHLLLGLPAFARTLRERYPLYVLNSVLGGTMSSRLFQRIREERGLVYTVYSGVNSFADTGFLNVYAATRPEQGREVLRLVREELSDLREHGPTADEIEVARENLKGSMMLSLESTNSRMSNLARQEIYYGRQLTLEEMLRGLDAVTPRRVQTLAGKLFAPGTELSLAAVGRVGRLRLANGSLRL